MNTLRLYLRVRLIGVRLRFHIWRAHRIKGWMEYHDCMIWELQLENQRLARELHPPEKPNGVGVRLKRGDRVYFSGPM